MQFKYKSSYLIFMLCLAGGGLFAQKEKLNTENVDVVKTFEARLLESNKLSVQPQLPKLDTTTQRQNYNVPARPLTVNYDAPKLRPIGMKSVKEDKPMNGFVKAGAGAPKTFWGEGGYYFAAKDKFDGKAWFRHHSLDANKSVENQKFFNNDFLLNGNYYINDQLAAEGKIAYSFDRFHYYGYPDSLDFTEEKTRQDFKILDISARLHNKERNDNDLNFSVTPQFYLLNDYYSNRETGFALDMTATKWFAEKHALRITIRPDATRFQDTVTQRLNNIYLRPSFTFHSDIVKIKVGGNFVNNRDEFSIFPDAEIGLRVIGDGVQIFAGANGDLRKNTYRSFSDYNPFLQIRGNTLTNTRWDNYYGGLRGDFGWLDYTGQFSYSKASDIALYDVFLEDGITRFRPIYDTVKITNIQGTVKFKPFEALVLTGTLSQNITMDVSKERRAWGLPMTEGNFGAVYTALKGKASLRANAYIADGIEFKDEQDVSREGKVLFDLNLGGSYYFTKNIGVFLDINNVLNNKRERWYRYPMAGTNFLAGFTARF